MSDEYATEKPTQKKILIKTAPAIRQFFWCNFPNPQDVHLPEFWKKRPVIILSHRNKINGSVIVVPCTTAEENMHNEWAVKLEQSINDVTSYAICDKITTIATSRLSLPVGGCVRALQSDFDEILKKIYTFLPTQKK